MHGWDGSHAIWEQIPALVCVADPRLVALAADVNGFGGSSFPDELPTLAVCSPAANMAAVERWIELLGLRSSRWRHFNVVLGHKDRLVGVKPMLELLEELGFASDQVHVVLGDHYLFSVSNQSRRLHLRNREIVVEEILALHEACRQSLPRRERS